MHFLACLVSFSLLFQVKSTAAPGKNKWDVVVKTCDTKGAGTDAAAYIKVFYQDDHHQETFQLDSPKDDFEQGRRDHFHVFLAQNDLINVGLYWWPSGTIREAWCVKWVVLVNAELDKCFVATFRKWILHYRNPPTYPRDFQSFSYSDCVASPHDLLSKK